MIVEGVIGRGLELTVAWRPGILVMTAVLREGRGRSSANHRHARNHEICGTAVDFNEALVCTCRRKITVEIHGNELDSHVRLAFAAGGQRAGVGESSATRGSKTQ